MLSVDEAYAQVLSHAQARGARIMPLEQALGCVLAKNVASDVDSPPHDKAMVDGYAVMSIDIRRGTELGVLEEVTAGRTPSMALRRGYATRIMTGAPVPVGADAVVMVEQTEAVGNDAVCILAEQAQAGQNIMPRAASMRAGDVVLRSGRELRAIDIGLLAEIGADQVSVVPAPGIAILSTGDELVPCDQLPAAGQIRNSNGPMLTALAERAGGRAINLGIGRDQRDELAALMEQGLTEDVLVLSGGVSAGTLDLVPETLGTLNVEQVFHKVRLKPGKPLWFGIKRDPRGDKLVFGLPGNPVSSLVCFELFVRPAIRELAGKEPMGLARRTAMLKTEFQHRGDRPTYHPARLHESPHVSEVELLSWKGSADLRALSDANCLACFPDGDRKFSQGERVNVLLLD